MCGVRRPTGPARLRARADTECVPLSQRGPIAGSGACRPEPLSVHVTDLAKAIAIAARACPNSPWHWGAHVIRKLKSGDYRLYSRKVNLKTGKRRNLGTFSTRA